MDLNFTKYIEVLGNYIQKSFQVIVNSKDFFNKSLLEYIFDIVDLL